MRSTGSCLKGRVTVDLIGSKGGTTGSMLALFCWQTGQPAMKCFTKVERPVTRSIAKVVLGSSKTRRAILTKRPTSFWA